MTKEDKKLLIKELCTRLPYGVKILYHGRTEVFYVYHLEDVMNWALGYKYSRGIKIKDLLPIKLYLRPMTSMTEEERKTYHEKNQTSRLGALETPIEHHLFRTQEALDWLNEHHFDYRGLIKKGLALEAKEGMYNTKQ